MVAGRKRYWTLFELLRRYGRYLRGIHREVVDIKRKIEAVKELAKFLREHGGSLQKCGPPEIAGFKEQLAGKKFHARGFSVKQKALRLYRVRQFFDWARGQGVLPRHPFPEYTYQGGVREFQALAPPAAAPQPYEIQVPEKYRPLVEELVEQERSRGLSSGTIRIHKRGWSQYLYYLERQEIEGVKSVTAKMLLEYQRSLLKAKDVHGRVLSSSERAKRLIAVKGLYKYLVKKGEMPCDPTSVIDLPPYERGLPKVLMSARELSRLFSVPDTKTLLGLRDRAILEVLFSTGIRSAELASLNISDVDFKNGFLRVNQPKGGASFQRVVPVGTVALDYVKRYLKKSRSEQREVDEKALFLTRSGARLHKVNLYAVVKNCVYKAGIRKNISPHCFRIACATEMLRRRADIRYVQAQLGHRSLQSTQIYARVVPTDLKKVHQRTHPREVCRGRSGYTN